VDDTGLPQNYRRWHSQRRFIEQFISWRRPTSNIPMHWSWTMFFVPYAS
jgi:hypothetical protein